MNKPIQLSSTLQLRFASAKDAAALGEFNQRIHEDIPGKDHRVEAWTMDLLQGKYPYFDPQQHCTIIEDLKTGKIVSSMLSIPQTWTYAGLKIKVDRPELVGTDSDYRSQGLIRKQFDIHHHISDQQGTLLQGITGIPYYYRLFGYEMAVELDASRKGFAPQQIPELAQGETEPLDFIPATKEDIPFIKRLTDAAHARHLLSCHRDEKDWSYELFNKSKENINKNLFFIIKDKQQNPIGVLGVGNALWGSTLYATLLEVTHETSWALVAPPVLRFLWKQSKITPAYPPKNSDSIGLALGSHHPVYPFVKSNFPQIKTPYTWYLRVADLGAFLQTITPTLNERLQTSPFQNITRDIKIGFYQSGVLIKIKDGQIIQTQNFRPESWDKVDAAFPNQTFLQLLFGYRNTSELRYAFADCWFKQDYQELLDALFPKKSSYLFPIS